MIHNSRHFGALTERKVALRSIVAIGMAFTVAIISRKGANLRILGAIRLKRVLAGIWRRSITESMEKRVLRYSPKTRMSYEYVLENKVMIAMRRYTLKSSLCLSLFLLLMLPAVGHAQFTFITNNGAITITGYTDTNGLATIPTSTNNYPVTNIGTNAFSDCPSLISVIIPSSVGNIGNEAFSQCSSLIAVYCQGNAPTLGDLVFTGDTNATVYYLWGNFGWGSTFGGLPTAQNPASWYAYTTTNGTAAIVHYLGASSSPIIPTIIYGLPVTSIEDRAFNGGLAVTSVTIPNTITNIGSLAFSGNHLTSITIPDSVTQLGIGAFDSCRLLTNAVIGNGVMRLPGSLFSWCVALTTVTIGNSVTSIDAYVFQNCSSLTSVCIPNSVTNIGDDAFYQCWALTKATIPSGLANLGDYSFYQCHINTVEIPTSLANIGAYTFTQCLLTNVMIPNGVTNIGTGAFQGCSHLTNVTISCSVVSIGASAFFTDYKLEGVYCMGDAPRLGLSAFTGDFPASVYYLPGTTGWSNTFGGLPAVLWNPTMQTANASFGVVSNQFGFNITGTTNIPIIIEASTHLQSGTWIPLQSCTLTNGSIHFSDPQWTNYPTRFYCIRSP